MSRIGLFVRAFLEAARRPVNHIEWVGAGLVLVFGLVFIVAVPPMQGADESNHFLRTYQISEGHLLATHVGQSQGGIATYLQTFDKNVGGELPRGVVDFTFDAFSRIPQHSEQKSSKRDMKRLGEYRITDERKAAAFGNTAGYSPLAYLPQVITVGIGKLFTSSPLALMYLARLATLAIGVFAIFWTLRLMPFGKLATAVILLLPMSVAQFSIVTADAAAFACAFVGVALTLKLAFQARAATKWEYGVLIGVFGLLGFVKPSLLPLALISLALLHNKFIPPKKAWLIAGASVAATLLCGLLWNTLVKDVVITGFHYSYPHNDYAAQLSFILHEPWEYVRVLANTFLTGNLNYVPTSFVGYFGWADTPIPLLGVAAGFILVGLAVCISSLHDGRAIPRWIRWLAALIIGGVATATATYMYLFCNAPRDAFIVGIQGRYFIPVLGLLPLLFLSSKQVLPSAPYAVYARRCLIASVILLFIMACVTIARFYNAPALLG